jgi:hypothetical protein
VDFVNPDKQRIFLISLLAIQFLGVGVWLPTHRDVDYSVWQLQSKVQEHKDNGPCHDTPLSENDYCAICAAAQARVSFKPVFLSFGQFHVVGILEALSLVTPSQQIHFDSFSRRAPPSPHFG